MAKTSPSISLSGSDKPSPELTPAATLILTHDVRVSAPIEHASLTAKRVLVSEVGGISIYKWVS